MNTENKIAEQMHQQTIDLQAVIIANQQKDIDRLNSLLLDNADEKAKLKETIKWYQGRTGQRMGEAARAEIAGAAVRGAGEVPEDVRYALDRMCLPLDASRLSGVTAAEDARCMAVIKEHIERSAAPAAPSEQAEPIRYDLMMGGMVEKSLGEFVRYSDCRPAPAAPLPAQPEQSATDWRIYHSALSRCAELLDNMADNDALIDTPIYLAEKLAALAAAPASASTDEVRHG